MKHATYMMLALLCCSPLTAFAFRDGPIDGQVIDAVTGKPIAGAVVLATWEHGLLEGSACEHAETAITDSQGRYHINKWGHIRNPIEWIFTTPFVVVLHGFKAGYSEAPQPKPVMSLNDITGEIKLVKFEGTSEKRLDYLSRLPDPIMHCGLERQEPLLPYLQAIYDEAEPLATSSRHDQVVMYWLRYTIHPPESVHSINPKTGR